LTLGGILLFLAGIYFTLSSRDGKRFRMLGWMYLIPLLLFLIAKGRAYYLAAAYPMMYAAGAVWLEKTLSKLGSIARNVIRVLVWIVLAADAALIAAFTLPIAPANSAWAARAMKVNEDFREEIGWPELVATIAEIRDSLPPEDRAHLGILAGNYGEAGAVNLYGPQYGLPRVISGVNSFWQQGYGDPPPQTLIVVGRDLDEIEGLFASCHLVAHTWNSLGVMNEETRGHPNIFVCRGPRIPWPEYWKTARHYG
jgi:hypothetical protein